MPEGGDRQGLRRPDVREEGPARCGGGVSLGREVSLGRKVPVRGGAGIWEAGFGSEDPQLRAWGLAVQVAGWAWPLDGRQTQDGESGTGLGCPREELCLRA